MNYGYEVIGLEVFPMNANRKFENKMHFHKRLAYSSKIKKKLESFECMPQFEGPILKF